MFCDLVGSTELASRLDPEDLREVIGRYHARVAETVRRFDGFVAKYMGDGVLIYFGYPQAHENDAEQAVRAGLALVDAVRELQASEPLQVRIGIATGVVVVGDLIGAGSAQEQAIVGETPNLAARLQSLADPGAVVIADSTRRQIGALFEMRDLGLQVLKGFADDQRAWRVLSENRALGRFEALRGAALAPLVGREEELELLLRRWEQAKADSGKVMLISGEPGIGKSRLTRALQDAIVEQSHVELRFFCSPNHQDSALHPHIAQLERAAGFARDDRDEARLAKLRSVLAQSDATDEAIALIAELLSIPTGQRERIQQMKPQLRRDKTLAALVAQLTGLASHQPVLMIYEDIHWIDPSSRELLDRTIEQLGQSPVLLLATFRPEFQPPWMGQTNVTSLTLTRLDRRHTTAMIAGIAGAELPTEIAQEIAERTDGVPLFIEEVTKAAIESGAQATATLSSLPHPKLAVPPTLHASLIARLDRLGTAARDVAQKGAAIGREFRYELIACIADRPEPELRDALEKLTGSGLLLARGAPPESTYLFKHALVQDTAYGTLVRTARQQVHARITAALEARWPEVAESQPELLAHHYTEAKQPEKAIPLWHKAGALALKRFALTEAIAHLNWGLELVAALHPSKQRDSWELDLRILMETAWSNLKGWAAQEVWDSLHPALGLAISLRRNDALPAVMQGLYRNILVRGQIAESLRWATQILDAGEVYQDQDLLQCGHRTAAISHMWIGELTKARDHAQQALACYTEQGSGQPANILSTDQKTIGLGYLAHVTWLLGYPDQAAEISGARDVHARQGGNPLDLGFALTVGTQIFDCLGQPDEQLKRVEEADRLGRENSLPFLTENQVPIYSGVALIRRGQCAEGIASLKKGLIVWEKTGARLLCPYWKSVLAEGTAKLGDLDSALNLIEESIAQVELPGWEERRDYAEILRIKGWLLERKGDLEGAERSYLASLDWARKQQAKSWELRTATSYARLMRDLGRVTEAYELLAPVYGWFTEGFGTKDLIEAKALLDELAAVTEEETPVVDVPGQSSG